MGGHFSLYHILHRIRFHHGNIYATSRAPIDGCRCLGCNEGARAASELLSASSHLGSFHLCPCRVPAKQPPDLVVSWSLYVTRFCSDSATERYEFHIVAKKLSILSFCDMASRKCNHRSQIPTYEFSYIWIAGIQHHLPVAIVNAILVLSVTEILECRSPRFWQWSRDNCSLKAPRHWHTHGNSPKVLCTDLVDHCSVGREFHFPSILLSIDMWILTSDRSSSICSGDDWNSSRNAEPSIHCSSQNTELPIANIGIRSQLSRVQTQHILYSPNVQVQSKQSSGMVKKPSYVKEDGRIVKDYRSGAQGVTPHMGDQK
jgi:hypothetical protein